MIRYHARWVLPITAPPIEHGVVAVHGRVIKYVGPASGAPSGDDVLLGDALLLPGLVNAHTRVEHTALRGLLDGVAPHDREAVFDAARADVLTDAVLLDSARLGFAEGLAAGITTFADTGVSGMAMRAMRELGVRGIAYQEVAGADPAERSTRLAGLVAAVRRLRGDESELVRVGVAPSAMHAIDEDLLIDACAFALGERLPIAIEVAASDDEIAFLREAAGPFADRLRERGIPVVRRSHSPVHLLVELGVDIARPALVHCVKLDASDVAFIAERGCPVVHCPSSDALPGNGIAPIAELLAAGAVVGLGTGSVASGGRMDLLDEARVALVVQRARAGTGTRRATAFTPAQALELATIGGARALGISHLTGSLEVGKDADLAVFSLADARTTPAPADPAATAVLAIAGRPAMFVTVAGEVRIHDGRTTSDVDPGLRSRVERAAARLVRLRATS